MTSGDNTNIVAARIARETYDVPNVVARIYDPRRATLYQRLGIPTVATVTWTTDQVMRKLLPEESTPVWTDPLGGVKLIQRPVPDEWAGRKVRELDDRDGFSVVALTRDGHHDPGDRRPDLPRGRRALRHGRRRRPSDVRRDLRLAHRSRRTLVKVAIAGAGKVGSYIAGDLQRSHHEVVVIERDARTADRIRDELEVTVREADACEISELHAAGLDDVDVMVAATGEDQVNLVVSLIAKQEFAIPRVVARGQPPQEPVAVQRVVGRRRLGVEPAPADGPGRRGRVGRFARAAPAAAGERGQAGRGATGRGVPVRLLPLAELHMPRDATIVAVVRGGHVIVPNGETTLEAGDEVLALVTPESEADLKAMLVGS